jgi:hypothetical protein
MLKIKREIKTKKRKKERELKLKKTPFLSKKRKQG